MSVIPRGWCRIVLAALPLLLLRPAAARAQSVRSASIGGTITDETGALLPGVTVTVSGSALQVPALVQTSQARGDYQFLDLSPGTYRVEYELAGFARLVRSE